MLLPARCRYLFANWLLSLLSCMPGSFDVGFDYRGYSGLGHGFLQHSGRWGRVLEVCRDYDSLGNSQGRPTSLVLLVPDFDFGSPVDQQLSNRRSLFVGCAMECSLAVLIYRIYVCSELQ